jgi:hypothetical protein
VLVEFPPLHRCWWKIHCLLHRYIGVGGKFSRISNFVGGKFIGGFIGRFIGKFIGKFNEDFNEFSNEPSNEFSYENNTDVAVETLPTPM